VTEIQILWLITAIIIFLDLLVTAVQASLSHTRLPHLLNLRENRVDAVDKTVNLLEKPRLQLGLRLAEVFFHLFFGGVVMGLIMHYSGNQVF